MLTYLQGYTQQNIGSADTMVYFGDGRNYQAKYGGVAYLGSVCSGNKKIMQAANFWFGTVSTLAEITAHELGHALGARHDTDHVGKGCENSGIMSSVTTKWSHCSKADVQAHYINRKNHWCMPGNS